MVKKVDKKYEITYEVWYWNEDEKLYCDGPFEEKNFDVNTLEEAKACIREFKLSHPGSKREKVDYDETDPDMGILVQKYLCAQTWNYTDEATNEKCQLEFTVFKLITEKE